jgi:hypothetical protein
VAEYEVKWNGTGSGAVAYVSGPGVDALRLGSGEGLDAESVAKALSEAFDAGRLAVAEQFVEELKAQ